MRQGFAASAINTVHSFVCNTSTIAEMTKARNDQPPADDWSEDPDTRRRLIRDYLSASPGDQEAMRQQHPDIEAEASEDG